MSLKSATRIAITSGKGGVGKTSLSVNLSVALARLGHRVGLVDADFALGNVDVLLGLSPEQHLGSVLSGARSVNEIALAGPAGVQIFPAGSGLRALTSLDAAGWSQFGRAVDEASRSLDFLLFDTATGISDNVLGVIGLSDYVIVLASYEPASVVDAYATIKLIASRAPDKRIGVVVNSARDASEADVVFKQLSRAADRFLKCSLRYDGYVVDDPAWRESLIAQTALVETESSSAASRCVRRLASRLAASQPGKVGPWAFPMASNAYSAGRSSSEAPCA